MTIVIFKFLHIAAISVWAGGLMALPFLYWQRRRLEGEPLHMLHAFTRRLYVMVVSPTAFVGIFSGTVLIFLRETYSTWFALKLGLIALLVGLHLLSGLLILKLFRPEGRYRLWRFIGEAGASAAVTVAIVAVVLAKPAIELWPEAEQFLQPGELRRIAVELSPWAIP